MNETMLREKVHRAVDNHCAHLRDDYWLAQRVIAMAREQERNEQPEKMPKRRSKLSVGLIVAIVLTLMSVTAVAAVVLSARQIVEETAIPMAQDTEGDRYTLEDTNLLVQLAKENGLVLSDNAMASITAAGEIGEGYWKEELLMAMAKAEFGDAPERWTLEQQKWFDDVCVAIGFIDAPHKGLPDEPAQASAAALEAANAYLHENYGAGDELLDDASYAIGIQYINGINEGDYDGMYWSIDYQPLALELSEYWVYLNDTLEVWGDNRYLGVTEDAVATRVRERFTKLYGMENEWTPEIWVSLHEELQGRFIDSEWCGCIAYIDFILPPEGGLTQDEAKAYAMAAVNQHNMKTYTAVCCMAKDGPVWKVDVQAFDTDGSFMARWWIELDGMTGEVRDIIKTTDFSETDALPMELRYMPRNVYEMDWVNIENG